MDRRNVALVFKACLMEMGENLLLDFRLSKVSSFNQYIHLKFCSCYVSLIICDNQDNINILVQTVSLPQFQIPGIAMKLQDY